MTTLELYPFTVILVTHQMDYNTHVTLTYHLSASDPAAACSLAIAHRDATRQDLRAYAVVSQVSILGHAVPLVGNRLDTPIAIEAIPPVMQVVEPEQEPPHDPVRFAELAVRLRGLLPNAKLIYKEGAPFPYVVISDTHYEFESLDSVCDAVDLYDYRGNL